MAKTKKTAAATVTPLPANVTSFSETQLTALIKSEAFTVEGRTTTCTLTLTDGQTVTGATTAITNLFDAEHAKEEARNNAREEVWALLGYPDRVADAE